MGEKAVLPLTYDTNFFLVWFLIVYPRFTGSFMLMHVTIDICSLSYCNYFGI